MAERGIPRIEFLSKPSHGVELSKHRCSRVSKLNKEQRDSRYRLREIRFSCRIVRPSHLLVMVTWDDAEVRIVSDLSPDSTGYMRPYSDVFNDLSSSYGELQT